MNNTVRLEKVDEKNAVIGLVSMFPSWVMALKLSKKVHFLQFCADLSKKSKSVKAIYIYAYEGTGISKISIFKRFSELGKIPKCSVGYWKIPMFYLFHELGKSWKYIQPKTNISKSKFWIYWWIWETTYLFI